MGNSQVRYRSETNVNLSNQQINYIVTVSNSWAVSVSFTYQSTDHDFMIIDDDTSFINFLRLYIQETNDQKYGTIDPVTDAVVADSNIRDLFASLVVAHFFSCLDMIFATKGQRTLDYAVWFLDNIDSSSSYSQLVQESVCQFVVDNYIIYDTETHNITNWSAV